jgi:hypothetical protein
VSFIFASLHPPAFGQVHDPDTVAHRLLVRSGMAVQLRSFTVQVEREIRQNAVQADPKMVVDLGHAAKEAFRPERLQEEMTSRVTRKVTIADMQGAMGWLESETGRKITLAEELASATMDDTVLRQHFERLKVKPATESRRRLLAELVSVTNAIRTVAAMQESIALGVALGMDSMQPAQHRVGEAEIRARLQAVMPPDKVHAALAEQVPFLFDYIYRDIAEPELKAYVAFLKTGIGKRYQAGMDRALIETLSQASIRLGEVAGRRQQQTAM